MSWIKGVGGDAWLCRRVGKTFVAVSPLPNSPS